MSEKNKEVIEKVNAAFAAGSNEGFLSFCAEDVEWRMVGHLSVKGKDAVRKWLASMEAGPPEFTVEHTIAEGDFVVTRGHLMAKGKDGAAVVPYSFCDVYRFRDGEIVELSAFIIQTEARHETSGPAS